MFHVIPFWDGKEEFKTVEGKKRKLLSNRISFIDGLINFYNRTDQNSSLRNGLDVAISLIFVI